MDGGEGDPLNPQVERRQHHVGTVQRMDKIRRKPIPVLARIDTEAWQIFLSVPSFQKILVKIHFFVDFQLLKRKI